MDEITGKGSISVVLSLSTAERIAAHHGRVLVPRQIQFGRHRDEKAFSLGKGCCALIDGSVGGRTALDGDDEAVAKKRSIWWKASEFDKFRAKVTNYFLHPPLACAFSFSSARPHESSPPSAPILAQCSPKKTVYSISWYVFPLILAVLFVTVISEREATRWCFR